MEFLVVYEFFPGIGVLLDGPQGVSAAYLSLLLKTLRLRLFKLPIVGAAKCNVLLIELLCRKLFTCNEFRPFKNGLLIVLVALVTDDSSDYSCLLDLPNPILAICLAVEDALGVCCIVSIVI